MQLRKAILTHLYLQSHACVIAGGGGGFAASSGSPGPRYLQPPPQGHAAGY